MSISLLPLYKTMEMLLAVAFAASSSRNTIGLSFKSQCENWKESIQRQTYSGPKSSVNGLPRNEKIQEPLTGILTWQAAKQVVYSFHPDGSVRCVNCALHGGIYKACRFSYRESGGSCVSCTVEEESCVGESRWIQRRRNVIIL